MDTPTQEQTPPAEAQPAEGKATLDITPELLAALGIPADQATPESVLNAITQLAAKAGQADTQVADSASKLAALQAELDGKRTEFEALYQKQQELENAKRDAEVDTILEQFADRLTDEKAKTRIRALLLSDRESAMDILNALPAAAAAAAPGAVAPPPPIHDPAAQSGSAPSEQEIAAAIKVRVAELQKAQPKAAYNSLFAQAEKEVRAKAQAGQPL